jgi:hypothetical protein
VISAGRMAQLGEWSRFNNQGQSFPREDSFSLGCTVISAGRMAQLDEWYRCWTTEGGGESVVTVIKQLYPFLNSLQNTQ